MDYSYLDFENRFRGSEEQVREDLRKYLPFFAGGRHIVDIGCGRGEFLELLREQGSLEAYGVDIDDSMLARCRSKGLTVKNEEALSHLRGTADEALDGIFICHVVEHLIPSDFQALVAEAFRALRKGGSFAAETLNPACFWGLTTFTIDLSHRVPIHPLTFQFLLEAQGFREISFLNRQYLPEEMLTLTQISAGPDSTMLERACADNMQKLQLIISCAFRDFIYGITAKK